MTLEQGDLLYNRYRILDILGRGGMGSVYHAIDESLGVEVAVKENSFVTEEYEQQFKMEAVILASLRHPNLPRVTDHFTIEGQGQYLVMDYIEGRDLRHLMDNGPLAEDEVVRIGVAVCDALSYLHTRPHPILHRDIKPGNVRIAPDGQVYLVDFGLAKMVYEGENTMSGARAMTPGYSPPEQYGTSRTDARTDVYSLGATLYAALTGFIPEDGLARVVDEVNLTPLLKRNPKISKPVAAAIEKAMEPQSAKRYQSAEEFKQALLNIELAQLEPEAAIAPQQVPAKPPVIAAPVKEKPESGPRKVSPLVWALAGIVVLLLLFAIPLRGMLGFGISATATSAATTIPSSVPSQTTKAPADPTEAVTLTAPPASTATSQPVTVTPAGALTVSPTFTSTAGRVQEIAFASMQDTTPQIFLINADGSNLKPLVHELNGACQPSWSPDGKKLVYTSPCADKSDVYPKSSLRILDLESGETSSVPTSRDDNFEPAWSPDGAKIAFTSLVDNLPQIFIYNLNDQSVTQLTKTAPGKAQSRQAAWSLPDGKKIVYVLRLSSLSRISIMNADGTDQAQLPRSSSGISDYLPAWSPDGSSLVFSETNQDLTAPSSLVRFAFDTQKTELLPIPLPVVDADFSRDGRWLAYETLDDKQNKAIYIYNFFDGTRQPLRTSNDLDFDPAWRP